MTPTQQDALNALMEYRVAVLSHEAATAKWSAANHADECLYRTKCLCEKIEDGALAKLALIADQLNREHEMRNLNEMSAMR